MFAHIASSVGTAPSGSGSKTITPPMCIVAPSSICSSSRNVASSAVSGSAMIGRVGCRRFAVIGSNLRAATVVIRAPRQLLARRPVEVPLELEHLLGGPYHRVGVQADRVDPQLDEELGHVGV